MAQLRARHAEFDAKGAGLAAIGLGDTLYARLFREETDIDFPLLIDRERQAYRIARLKSASPLHLIRPDNARARRQARASGFRQHKMGKNPFQLGGSFIFGPGNLDLFSHVSRTFGDNAAPDVLLAALP